MNRFTAVFAVLAVLVRIAALNGTSSPTPVTAVAALAYGAVLAAPPVAFWYAFTLRRRQRKDAVR